MYEEFFGLAAAPFDLNTNPAFLYLSPDHARARAYLDYAVYKCDSLVVITGEIGAGKSTLIHDLMCRVPKKSDFLVIRHPHAEPVGFLQEVAREWGCKYPASTTNELLNQIREELAVRFVCGTRSTLIIDEAQTLSIEVLEELRMLADHEIHSEKPLSIVFVGQPCLRETLAGRNMEQLRQRIRLSFHLPALDRHETKGYIERRLAIAGAKPYPIFMDETIPRIHKYTGGIPRLLNVLCDLSLTAAWMEGNKQVTAEIVNEAINELGWTPYSRRAHRVIKLPGVDEIEGQLTGAADRWGQQALRGAAVASRHTRQWFTGFIAETARLWETTWVPFTRWLKQKEKPNLRQIARRSRVVLLRGSQQLIRRARFSLAALVLWYRRLTSGPARFRAGLVQGVMIGFVGAMLMTLILPDSNQMIEPGSLVDASELTVPTVATKRAKSTPREQDMDAYSGEPAWLLSSWPDPQETQAGSDYAGINDGGVIETPASLTSGAGYLRVPGRRLEQAGVDDMESVLRGLQSESWVLAQSPESYVIQILAAKKPEVVDRFLEGSITELDIAYYRRQRNDGEWYVLVNGVYPSYQAAKQASLSLPAQALKAKPWIRRVTSVQKDILEAQQSSGS